MRVSTRGPWGEQRGAAAETTTRAPLRSAGPLARRHPQEALQTPRLPTFAAAPFTAAPARKQAKRARRGERPEERAHGGVLCRLRKRGPASCDSAGKTEGRCAEGEKRLTYLQVGSDKVRCTGAEGTGVAMGGEAGTRGHASPRAQSWSRVGRRVQRPTARLGACS